MPIDRVAEFVEFAQNLEKDCGLRIRSMGHAGDGNLHIYALRDQLDQKLWKEKIDHLFDRLYSHASEIGGKVSGEHGIGSAKLPYQYQIEGKAVMQMMYRIKQAFDPNEILNPGKVVQYN